MAKVYESKAPQRGLFGQKFRVKFLPDSSTVTKDNPSGYGSLTSDDELLLKKCQVGSEEIEQLIESEPDFKRGVPGQSGIWLRKARISAEGRTTLGGFRAKLAEQGEESLRQIIADNGGEVPVSGDIETFVDAAFKALGKPKSTKSKK